MLKKIAVVNVMQGMYLHELCGSWMDHPFWKAGFVLQDSADLYSLKNSAVTEVWIDTSKGLDLPASVASEAPEEVVERAEAVLQAAEGKPQQSVPMSDEIKRALDICERSKHAVISLGYLPDAVTLDIFDDGSGMDTGEIPAKPRADGTGYGLVGLRERLDLLDGSLEIESAPGEGTVLAVRIPLTTEESSL